MPSLMILAVLIPSIAVAYVDACSSSISKRPSRPNHPTAPPHVSAPPPTQRSNVTFPTYKCPHLYDEFYCLNDGKCFIVLIKDSSLYNCECKDGFEGQRCEYKNLDGSYTLSRGKLMLETASIAGGATVAVFLAVVVCFWAWVRLHRRTKEAPPEVGALSSTRGATQLLAVQSGARCVHVPLEKALLAPAAGDHGALRPSRPLAPPLTPSTPAAGDARAVH